MRVGTTPAAYSAYASRSRCHWFNVVNTPMYNEVGKQHLGGDQVAQPISVKTWSIGIREYAASRSNAAALNAETSRISSAKPASVGNNTRRIR